MSPLNVYSSEPIMSWGNIKYVSNKPEDMPYTVHTVIL